MLASRMSIATALERRFFSLKKMAPQTKVMSTELRRRMDTTESMAPSPLNDRKYRKSDQVMKSAMTRISQSCW